MNLKTKSLEELGHIVASVNAELRRRIGTPTPKVVEGLLEYHTEAYKKDKSPKNCRELVAIGVLNYFTKE